MLLASRASPPPQPRSARGLLHELLDRGSHILETPPTLSSGISITVAVHRAAASALPGAVSVVHSSSLLIADRHRSHAVSPDARTPCRTGAPVQLVTCRSASRNSSGVFRFANQNSAQLPPRLAQLTRSLASAITPPTALNRSSGVIREALPADPPLSPLRRCLSARQQLVPSALRALRQNTAPASRCIKQRTGVPRSVSRTPETGPAALRSPASQRIVRPSAISTPSAQTAYPPAATESNHRRRRSLSAASIPPSGPQPGRTSGTTRP